MVSICISFGDYPPEASYVEAWQNHQARLHLSGAFSSLAVNLVDWTLTPVMAWICHVAVSMVATLTMEVHMELHVYLSVVLPAVAWDRVWYGESTRV